MEWILPHAEQYRRALRSGAIFNLFGRRDDRDTARRWTSRWAPQLLHQSREFTQALSLRYARCSDAAYVNDFCEHAGEEIDHPTLLTRWMQTNDIWPYAVATPETIDSVAFCWRSAMCDPHDVQVIALNVLSEGVALDFYSAAIPFLEWLGLESGKYWRQHREVDAHHLRLGLDRIAPCEPQSDRGKGYLRVLSHATRLYDGMLTSWARLSLPESDLNATSESSIQAA